MYPTLQAGDTIAIIATARFVSREDLIPFITDVESWGLKVILGPHLFEVNHQMAGTDEQKAEALQWAMEHPEVKAIFCARGGYGTLRMTPLLNLAAFKLNPKPIYGFSDVTVLHSALSNLNIPSVHSTMCLSWKDNTEAAKQSVKDMLFKGPQTIELPNHPLNRTGECTGKLVGGNLSILYSLNGTPYFPDLTGKILFIEDLDEYLYHIDRMMQNFKCSGVYDKITGLVIGGMTDMNDNAIPFGKTAEEIIREAVESYSFPVYFNAPVGHINNNLALLMGGTYSLAEGKLRPVTN